MKPPPFDYARAESVEEAVALLAKHGDEAKIIAGGQSLMPMLAFRMAATQATGRHWFNFHTSRH